MATKKKAAAKRPAALRPSLATRTRSVSRSRISPSQRDDTLDDPPRQSRESWGNNIAFGDEPAARKIGPNDYHLTGEGRIAPGLKAEYTRMGQPARLEPAAPRNAIDSAIDSVCNLTERVLIFTKQSDGIGQRLLGSQPETNRANSDEATPAADGAAFVLHRQLELLSRAVTQLGTTISRLETL